MYGYYIDPTWLLVLAGMVVALIAQAWVNRAYRKYSEVYAKSGITAEQAVGQMLHDQHVEDVGIEEINGTLSDHYDPRDQVLRLSQGVYGSTSIAALGVAAHEAGHAVQDYEHYAPLKMRTALVPMLSFTSKLAMPLFIAGLLFTFEPLLWAGIIFFGLAVIFSLMTLPVEFNASSRALLALETGGYLDREEILGARKVLRAAAFTYVASALTAILQLIRLLALARGGRRSSR